MTRTLFIALIGLCAALPAAAHDATPVDHVHLFQGVNSHAQGPVPTDHDALPLVLIAPTAVDPATLVQPKEVEAAH